MNDEHRYSDAGYGFDDDVDCRAGVFFLTNSDDLDRNSVNR